MTNQEHSPGGSPTRGSVRNSVGYAIKSVFGVLFFGLLLFLPAGTFRWPMAWIYLILFLLVVIASSIISDPELLRDERGVGQAGRKSWDLALVSVYGLLTAMATPIVSGLDWRYGWTPFLPVWLSLLVVIPYVLGWAFGLWAMGVNRYYSKVVRIQHERGHQVVQSGPYRWVRHPGYLGAPSRILGCDHPQPGNSDHSGLLVGHDPCCCRCSNPGSSYGFRRSNAPV
jgi:protein-S-isoprenylcysteine O-methyltransferase Ste14